MCACAGVGASVCVCMCMVRQNMEEKSSASTCGDRTVLKLSPAWHVKQTGGFRNCLQTSNV